MGNQSVGFGRSDSLTAKLCRNHTPTFRQYRLSLTIRSSCRKFPHLRQGYTEYPEVQAGQDLINTSPGWSPAHSSRADSLARFGGCLRSSFIV